MITAPCFICGGFNSLDVAQCAHCGTRIIDVGDVETNQPITLRIHMADGVVATQSYIPSLETKEVAPSFCFCSDVRWQNNDSHVLILKPIYEAEVHVDGDV